MRARAIARLTAPAWPVLPPPWVFTSMSNFLPSSTAPSGFTAAIREVVVVK